jgi:hypothetical protein
VSLRRHEYGIALPIPRMRIHFAPLTCFLQHIAVAFSVEPEHDRAQSSQTGDLNMVQRRLRQFLMVLPIALLVIVALPTSAAAGPDHRTVKAYDDCEQASFNAAIGPGTCVGDGETTITDFVGQLITNGYLANKSAPDWNFDRASFDIDKGGRVTVENRGGEFHSFTEVADFSKGGCVALLNSLLGPNGPAGPPLAPGAVCPKDLNNQAAVQAALAPTGVLPGASRTFGQLKPGVHFFQCMIHPWMQSTAYVER